MARFEADARVEASAGVEDDFDIGSLFSVVPDAVIIGDASTGQIVVWNPAAATMFGYELGEGAGLLIEDLVPAAMKEAHRDGIARLARGEPTPLIDSESVVELPACRKDGGELWIELRLAHVAGRRQGQFALAIIRDITIRREAEAARAAAIEELERLRHELEERNDELDLISRTDYLTRVWNRRHVEEHLAMAVSAARRHGRGLCVLLLDVDRFKDINTRHGHLAGDATLRELARRFQESIRTEDTLGRFGGDEFLVILPDTSLDDAFNVAERLRQAVADTPITIDGVELHVTLSAGVAACSSADSQQLLGDADSGLGRAKAGGRNRTSG